MRQNENSQQMKLLPKLNYSEKLFLSRNQERKKKIDHAFNSISDTNNQEQISYALRQVKDIGERKQLISKIIKRKKEIEDMQEINTINSLAPLFSKIKQKFFNNLYKKTGKQNHLLLSQGRDPYSKQQSFQSSSSLTNEPQVLEKQQSLNEENKQQSSSLNPSATSPSNSPQNTDQQQLKKRQTHLLSALTFLSTRSKTNHKQRRQSIRQSCDNPYFSEGGNALKYLTKDPYIFKADLNYNKEQKKFMQKSSSQDIKASNDQQQIESDSKAQKNKLKQIKSKVEHYKQNTSFKKEILTNHTSLKKLLNCTVQNKQTIKNPKILLIDDYDELQREQNQQFLNDQNNDKIDYFKFKEQCNDNLFQLQTLKLSPQNQKNSIFKSQHLEMSEKNFAYDSNFSNYLESNKKSRSEQESQITNEFDLNMRSFNKQNNKNIFFKDTTKLDEKDYIKGLPKINNFGGSYYYLGKKLPESYLYRYIIQCEQKRLYLKSDGQLFSNQPFTEELDKVNKISHIHKIFEYDKSQVNILQLKHNEQFASFPTQSQSQSQRNNLSLSKLPAKNSQQKQNQSIQPKPYSFMTQRKYSDTSTVNSMKGNQILNNTKDTDSLLSFQIPDNLKPHVIKGFYSPQQKLNIDDRIQKQYFVKVNYQL